MAVVYEAFLHNWASTVALDTNWLNAINLSAQDQVTEGRGLAPKPQRTLTVRWGALTQAAAHRLFFTLARAAHQRLRVPLYQDVSFVTAPSSGTTLHVDTRSRRFEDGKTLVVFEVVNGAPTNVQYAEASAHTDDTITLGGSITGTYPAGAVVMPLALVEIQLDTAARSVTDFFADAQMRFEERQVNAIGASAAYADVPADSYTALNGADYYLLSFGPNWAKGVSWGWTRTGEATALGRDKVVVPARGRARALFSFSCDETTRADFFALLQFFDGHNGRLVPFFVANPKTIWSVTNIGTTFVDVVRSGDIDDPTTFVADDGYVYLEMNDGSVYVSGVTAVADHSGANRLSLDQALPGGLLAVDVARCTTAHLCRFKSDTLHEEWATDHVVSVAIEVEESINEEIEVEP